MNQMLPLSGTIFLEGPAGTGKTTEATAYVRRLLQSGVPPEKIFVLVPQRTLGRVYQRAAYEAGPAGGVVHVSTLVGIAFESIQRYWPLVASAAGFANPFREPAFLNIETAQHFMARFANPAYAAGRFEGVAVSPARAISQTFDNLNKSALLGTSLDSVGNRLIAAWGDRQSTRPAAYRTSIELAEQFRAHCLENNLIDVSLGLKLFQDVLCADKRFGPAFFARYSHLVAENIEEDSPSAHDFVRWLLPHLTGALLIYDTDAGIRVFLGAEPDNAYTLTRLCDSHETRTESHVTSLAMQALIGEFDRLTGDTFLPSPPNPSPRGEGSPVVATPPLYGVERGQGGEVRANPLRAFRYSTHSFFPQMINWAVETALGLLADGVAPRQIAIVAPYLSDSLRFSLMYPLEQAGVATLSHRPSRALRDEPPARALLALARIAYPTIDNLPPPADVADALGQAIEGLDPIRARILTGAVYGAGRTALQPFDELKPDIQTRVSYRLGEQYEQLRNWLIDHADNDAPLDHFWRRLFGEILAQPGFGFHRDIEAGRIAAQVIESARTFRTTLYPTDPPDWTDARREYFQLIGQGLLATLYAQSWQDDETDAVFLSPAITFLLRNRVVDHQIWLDVGSAAWSERLEQPLTHPYVLRREFEPGDVWTDDQEREVRRRMLHNVAVGLLRRCRKQVHLGIADLGEEGYEQRGDLLNVFQRIVQRYQSQLPGSDGNFAP